MSTIVTSTPGLLEERTWERGTYQTWHADPKCKRIVGEIIASDVLFFDPSHRALRCQWCSPESEPTASPPASGDRSARRRVSASATQAPSGTNPTTGPAPDAGPALPSRESPADNGSGAGARPNRYAGRCERCGSHVGEGSGILVRKAKGWGCAHRPGECQPSSGRAENTARAAGMPDVAEGHYAVETPLGLAFLRVDRPTEGQWAGGTYVKRISGGHPGEPVRGARALALLIMVEEQGADVCAVRYGQEIGRCSRCNKTLTDSESRRLGIGPECRRKR